MKFLKLEDIDVVRKTVLLRCDLNVPMRGGRITDLTRIKRLRPTLEYLIKHKARVVLLSHFGRPKGKYVPDLSLAPIVDALSETLEGKKITFGVDCIGSDAQAAVANLKPGDVVLLENLRFHEGEESGDATFAKELASLGDVLISDAFSCAHRSHASITGIAEHLPAAAGRVMQTELEILGSIFTEAQKPTTAIIGGSKVSSKLALLENLTCTMDKLIIGGAMANTFLYAMGHNVGNSLVEKDLKPTALNILERAKEHNCEILLPTDMVVTATLEPNAICNVVDIDAIPGDMMAVDIGPQTTEIFAQHLRDSKTIVWNGPVGAFEISPFDGSTLHLARVVAKLSDSKTIKSIAGGGDTLSSLNHAGLSKSFSYLSTAGGAFLEWLEGKTLPGVAILENPKKPAPKAKKHG